MKILILLTLIWSSAAFSINVQEGVLLFDSNKKFYNLIRAQKSLTIDHLTSKGYEVYGPTGLIQWLEQLDAPFIKLEEDLDEKELSEYPTPETIESDLKKLANTHPDIFKLVELGKSLENRSIWAVKLSDNVQVDETEPEVKYIANMHGNEIVGRELMVRLIKNLIIRYRQGDQVIRELLNNTEVWIVPTMNPDGSSKRRRGNATYADLNRDFPDFTTRDNTNIPEGRQPETKAIMAFQASRHFSLSANFHGGTLVVNYPWDTSPNTAPLTPLIIKLSKEYALNVPGMHDNQEFEDGIVNGYRWYEVDGGMQDWSYNWYNDLQVTIEVSHNKWPRYSEIPSFYNDNKKSLVTFLQRVHQGAGFKLSNSEEGSVEIIRADGLRIGKFSFDRGEFYKVLPIGEYRFNISSPSGKKTLDVSIDQSVKTNNGNIKHL